MPVILLTGFGDLLHPPGSAKPADVDVVLHKPVTLQDLRRAIFQASTRGERHAGAALPVNAENLPATVRV